MLTELMPKRLNIELPNFEGPMELLLYLVRKEELDIYDLPITYVVDQYIRYIEMMEELNLEIAGDYLVMAATLLDIKARYLLPEEKIEMDEEQLTPQEELAYMLIEYEKYHNIAIQMETIFEKESDNFTRSVFPELIVDKEMLVEPNLFDLIKSMSTLFATTPEFPLKYREEIALEIRMAEIMNILREKGKASFIELFDNVRDVIIIVATIFSLLELAKTKRIKILQRKNFGTIWINLLNPDDIEESESE